MSGFGDNFVEGLRGGVALKESWDKGREDRATQEAMAILSEAEAYDPSAGQFDPAAQAVPEDGQPARKSNQGYSGADFGDLGNRYFQALGKSTNIDTYAKGKLAWGAMKQARINDAGMAAINAYDRGDMEGAKKMIATASAFLSPGYTPEVEVDPKSGAFIIANYDAKGNPAGGMAVTRDNLVDFVNMNNNPQAWAESEDVNLRHGEEMDLRYKNFGAEQKERDQRMLLAQNADERAATAQRATLATQLLAQQLTGLQISDAERKLLAGDIADVNKVITDLITFDKTAADKLKAGAPSSFVGPTDPHLLEIEGGTFEGINPDGEHRGRIGWGIDRFNDAKRAGAIPPDMSFDEFAGPGVTEEGKKWQLNAEKWHWDNIDQFIIDQGLDKYIGQKDANGTNITWAGLRFAANIAGNGGMKNWVVNGVETKDNDGKGKGPSDWMREGVRATPVGSDAAPTATAEAVPTGAEVDPMGAFVDANGKEIEHTYAVDPWYNNLPDANGKVTPRAEVWNAMELMAMDLKKNNPEASTRQVASMAMDAFGPKPRGEVDPESDYYSDGVSQLKLSPEIANLVMSFGDANAELRARYEQQNNPRPYEVYTEEGGGQQQEAIPVSAPAPQAMPGAAAAAPAPAQAPAPAAGIPEPGAAPAPQPTVDATAVRTGQPVPEGQPAPAVSLPQSIARVPQLARAVQAWIDSGRSPQGQRAIAEIVSQLPDTVQQQVLADLKALVPARAYTPPAARRNANMPQQGGLY